MIRQPSDPFATARLLALPFAWAAVALVIIALRSGEGVWIPAVAMGAGAAFAAAPLYRYARRHRGAAAAAMAPAGAEAAAAEAIVRDVLPAWHEQVSAAREEGNLAVMALMRAFENLAAKSAAQLEHARAAVSDLTASDGALPALRATRADLEAVLKAMRGIEVAKERILAEAVRAGDLSSGLAAEVQQLALQTKLLAMNGAIEAARAGESGNAFAVVVKEMRDLADRTALTSQRMATQVSALTGAVVAVRRQEDEEGAAEAGPMRLAEAAVDSVVRRVDEVASHLVGTARDMERDADGIKCDVSDSLVALQFQDRVSQILGHAAANMAALRESFERPATGPAAGRWSERMAAFATRPEGFATLDVGPRAAGLSGGDITYL